MGIRLRTFAFVAILGFSWLTPEPAQAQGSVVYIACWTALEMDPVLGHQVQVTRCRLAGGEIVEYRRETDIPLVLNPNLGVDNDGVCWFLTSMSTPYVIVDQAANGEASIAFDPPTGGNSSLVPLGYFRRCTSEPRVGVWEEGLIWEYLASYLHPPPTPEMSPPTGFGVTGVAAFAGVEVPGTHRAVIGDPINQLELEVRVIAVVIDWGDYSVVTYPPSQGVLAGFPDGGAWHLYTAKNGTTTLSVSYVWDVRWRSGGAPWQTLNVPPTTTTLVYPVSEIISVLSR